MSFWTRRVFREGEDEAGAGSAAGAGAADPTAGADADSIEARFAGLAGGGEAVADDAPADPETYDAVQELLAGLPADEAAAGASGAGAGSASPPATPLTHEAVAAMVREAVTAAVTADRATRAAPATPATPTPDPVVDPNADPLVAEMAELRSTVRSLVTSLKARDEQDRIGASKDFITSEAMRAVPDAARGLPAAEQGRLQRAIIKALHTTYDADRVRPESERELRSNEDVSKAIKAELAERLAPSRALLVQAGELARSRRAMAIEHAPEMAGRASHSGAATAPAADLFGAAVKQAAPGATNGHLTPRQARAVLAILDRNGS